MNVERLYSVLVEINDEIDRLDLASLLQGVETTFAATLGQPNPTTAAAFNSALETLRHSCENCPSNAFPPSRERILESIQGTKYTGFGLIRSVDGIFENNRLAPAGALPEIQELRSRAKDFDSSIRSTILAFDTFNLEPEVLPPDVAEIGIAIPESLVNSRLEGLEKELHRFDRALRVFSEVCGSGSESFKIIAIGTGSLETFLASDPVTAAAIVTAIERIVALYKSILEIRIHRKKLKELSIPDATLMAVKEHEDKLIEDELGRIGEDLLKQNKTQKGDKGRKNELRNALKASLRFLADRIDRGVDIEVTLTPYGIEDGGEQDSGSVRKWSSDIEEAMQKITKSGGIVRELSRSQDQVLSLREVKDPELPPTRRGDDGDKE